MSRFCLVPWYGKEYHKKNNTPTSVCCWLDSGYNADDLRQQFLDGQEPVHCRRCWSNENAGLPSRRLEENSYYTDKLKVDFDQLVSTCRAGQAEPLFYQISLSNLCNQACVTCNPGASTVWQNLRPVSWHSYFSRDIELLDINWKTAQRITILGGEPLYDPKAYELLEKLLANNNTSCDIVFVTNGSVELTNEQKELFKQFPNVYAIVSIDGTDKTFEYLRWRGKWPQLLTNIEDYKTVFNNVGVSYTISALNFLEHEKTVAWFKDNNLNYNFNFVQWPKMFSVANMPVELKKAVPADHPLVDMVTITGQEVPIEELRREIVEQDNLKKISIQDYLPDMFKLIFVDS